jgi:hypothetical protein
MSRGVCFAFMLLAAGHAVGQSAAPEWFPVHLGDQWVYEHTTRDDTGEGRAHLSVHDWKTKETTIGVWTVAEGTVLERRIEVVGGAPPNGWRVSPTSAYLIRGNLLYAPEYAETGWNPATHTLTRQFVEGLRTFSSPDFCFPLSVSKTWGAPHGLPDWGVVRPEDARDWRVVGTRVHDPFAPDRGSTFHLTNISSYPGSGMTVDIWFEKEVGVVREVAIHHGTIGEEKTRLTRFAPAPR